MLKILNYFLQSILIYFFFLIGRIVGLKISRKIFSNLFLILGPIFKSKKIIDNNLNIFSKEIANIDKKKINSSDLLNVDLLKKLKIINKNSTKLKILGQGEIKDKINMEANLVSKSAVKKLEKIGGSIKLKK